MGTERPYVTVPKYGAVGDAQRDGLHLGMKKILGMEMPLVKILSMVNELTKKVQKLLVQCVD